MIIEKGRRKTTDNGVVTNISLSSSTIFYNVVVQNGTLAASNPLTLIGENGGNNSGAITFVSGGGGYIIQ